VVAQVLPRTIIIEVLDIRVVEDTVAVNNKRPILRLGNPVLDKEVAIRLTEIGMCEIGGYKCPNAVRTECLEIKRPHNTIDTVNDTIRGVPAVKCCPLKFTGRYM
jgi:hypothetical protein